MPDKIIYYAKLVYYSELTNKFRRIVSPFYIKLKLRGQPLRDNENFFKLHLGCGTIRFPGYINIDLRKTIATDYVCDVTHLPFPDESVEVIETYHMIQHMPKDILSKALKNWWNKLVPGGRLIMESPDFDQTVKEYLAGNENRLKNIFGLHRFKGDTHLWGYNFFRLKEKLYTCGYRGVKSAEPRDYHRSQEPCMRLEAYKSLNHISYSNSDMDWLKRKEVRPETLTIEWRRKHIHAKILNELTNGLKKSEKILSVGCGTGELEFLIGRKGNPIIGTDISSEALSIAKLHKIDEKLNNVQFVQSSVLDLPFPDNYFDIGYAIEVFEHIEPDELKKVINEVRRVLKPNAKFLLTTPNKDSYRDPGHKQFFTKGTLAELLDNLDVAFDWVEIEERQDVYRSHNILKAMLRNHSQIEIQEKKKICAIGAYEINRYTQLGFHWDGQARAFKTLGYQTRLLDIRKDWNFENIRSKILEFQPDFLWLGLKDCLPFIRWMHKDIGKLKNNGTKVIYWYCDIRKPNLINLNELVDIMFLSNAGQIDDYRSAYSIDNIFYMPQAFASQFMYKLDIPEIYDVGFAGTINGFFHKKRKKILNKIAEQYKVAIRNNVRNCIPNFYSSCRSVLGTNPALIDYLYTSNRIFIAMACGAFYICEWFSGIEKLVRNHEHVVWYKTDAELLDLLEFYLKNKEKRNKIRKNAQKLAHSKHTYTQRIQNMMDIINNESNEFYGFL